jgi:hypothetical protein
MVFLIIVIEYPHTSLLGTSVFPFVAFFASSNYILLIMPTLF